MDVGEYESKGIVKRNMKIGKEKWSVITLYNGKGMREISNVIEEMIQKEREGVIVIDGDFNARIGTEDTFTCGEEDRNEKMKGRSKDKVVNAEGEYLLKMLKGMGLHIMTGNMKGDENGEFTFVRDKDASIIDNGLNKIEKFRNEENGIGCSVSGTVSYMWNGKK